MVLAVAAHITLVLAAQVHLDKVIPAVLVSLRLALAEAVEALVLRVLHRVRGRQLVVMVALVLQALLPEHQLHALAVAVAVVLILSALVEQGAAVMVALTLSLLLG